MELKQYFPEKSFKIAGISKYQDVAHKINHNDQLEMKAEPENKFDNKAIAIYFNNEKVGYMPKDYKLRDYYLENTNEKLIVINKKLLTDANKSKNDNTLGIRVVTMKYLI